MIPPETVKVTPLVATADPETGVVRIEKAEVEKVVDAAMIDSAPDEFRPVPNRADRRAAAKRSRRRGR